MSIEEDVTANQAKPTVAATNQQLGMVAEKFEHFVIAEEKHKAIVDQLDLPLGPMFFDIEEEKDEVFEHFEMINRIQRLESVAQRRATKISIRKDTAAVLSINASKNIEKLVAQTKAIHEVVLSTRAVSMIASFLEFDQVVALNLVSRQFYERLIPEAMEKCKTYNNLRVQIKQMLASVPKDLDPKIVECMETHGPATINMFERIAMTYGLPTPDINESKTKFVTTTSIDGGEQVSGMFDRQSGKANGIIRKWRKDHMTEVFVAQNVGVGLRR